MDWKSISWGAVLALIFAVITIVILGLPGQNYEGILTFGILSVSAAVLSLREK